jgi:hypothetical protein
MSYQFGHVDPDERLDYAEELLPPGEEYAPRRRLPAVILGIGVMAIFAGGLWFAYYEGTKHAAVTQTAAAPDQVPLIHADNDPVKVKPDKAGGMNVPDKDDPLYALRPGGNPAEHILPPPEAPAPRPVGPSAPPPPAVAAAPAAPAVQPAPAPPPTQLAAVPKPAPPPSDAEAKPTPSGPPMKVQLASLRTPDEARDEWARLKREHGDLLGKFTAVAVRADLGERGVYYRVEVGPVGDKVAAIKLCKALKDRGLGCSLVQ